jgi:hypothetical protein
MTRKPTILDPGSISWGTMQTKDILPRLLVAVSDLRLTRGERRTVQRIERHWTTYEDEIQEWCLNDLFTIADNHCPDNHCCGAHPDDGADFGVWDTSDAELNGRQLVWKLGKDSA